MNKNVSGHMLDPLSIVGVFDVSVEERLFPVIRAEVEFGYMSRVLGWKTSGDVFE